MDQATDRQHRPPDGCPEGWLEGALAEALGQHGPPDLSQRILDALAHGGPVDVAPAVDRSTVRRRRSRRRNVQLLVWWGSALTLLLAASFSLRWVLDQPAPDQRIAQDPQDPPRPRPTTPRPDGSGGTAGSGGAGLALLPHTSADQAPPWESPRPEPSGPRTAGSNRLLPQTPAQVAQRIDQHFQTLWTASGKLVDVDVPDDEWLRRVWWGLYGTVPTAAEESEWLITLAGGSRSETIDQLMAPPRGRLWHQHWARLLATGWLNLSSEGQQADPVHDHQRLAEFCQQGLQAGDGLDDMAQRLVTATGSSDPSAGDYSPAVAFWQGTSAQDSGNVVDRICRGMLGTRLDCARCHDHPVGAFTQDQYWQLRAYFQLVNIDGQAGGHRRVFDQPPDGRSKEQGPGIYYQRSDSTMGSALPRWPIMDQDEGAGAASPASLARLRYELARSMVGSRSFARAMANRVWSGVMGVGLVSPIDDLGLHNRSPHTALLEQLTDELVAGQFDLAAAVKWVLLSRPLQVEGADVPMNQHEIVLFDRFPLKPMQLRSTSATLSLLVATSGGPVTLEEIERQGTTVLGQFQPSPRGPNDQNRQARLQPSQVVEWLNTKALRPELDEVDEALVVRLTAAQMPADQLVDHAFLALLRRLPTPDERRDAQQILAGTSSRDGLRRIWMALRSVAEAGDYR